MWIPPPPTDLTPPPPPPIPPIARPPPEIDGIDGWNDGADWIDGIERITGPDGIDEKLGVVSAGRHISGLNLHAPKLVPG